MRSFIVLASLAYMATVAIASKAADAEMFEAMQDRSAGMMDREHVPYKSQIIGQACAANDWCLEGLECIGSGCAKIESELTEVTNKCPAGWIPLANTCPKEGDDQDVLCVTIGAPLKYVSWFHLQYECDAIGGHLPEPTADNKVNLELVLSSIHSLYAKTKTPILMYLGATDVTHENEWKWLKTAGDLTDAAEDAKWKDNAAPTKGDTKDCLAQQSSDKLWTNVDCEDDTLPNQIANVCFASPATAKALPAA